MTFDWHNPYPTVRSPVFARNVVSTSHPLASQAGLRMLLAGGNAGPDLESTVPVALDRMLGDFPRLKVAVAHGGWPWVHQVLHIAFRRPNLYLSPDMYLVNMPGMSDYVRAADGFLCERFIYGSSFPLCPAKATLDWFNTLPISADNRRRILHDNARAFLARS